ncbi:MAG: FtsW/RodA/SpoVE family cell cycle protein [Caldilineaceae bacterium]|uniref:Probable peptidoglycan glycosyltransferase FtsW n=1 Tax=Caldilineaceae bacterium SB0664_bin_27 TaxID=2605260 RepID=A0A6B0YWB8_9CHLR|nr:FtsW/RodA/SpoVE family cell cycle protein [Caldilineaceae bacterium]MDE0339247.1 FtsW/RodA/SpoVE family cell cycle protein [Caldilineaceae bacterium]MXY95424.1 rod shape-determining protein RodA [Caldilineaceae bacterium SB0664_bin_27]
MIRHFDRPLFFAVLLLCAVGIAMTYSATITDIVLADYWQRQLVFTIMGAIALVIAALFDYRHLELLAQPSYFVLLASLVAVYFIGEVKNGAQRWLNLGIDVQPTEAGKFLLIVFFAWYLSRFQDRIRRLPYLLGAVILLLFPLVLVYAQPDLGMTVTLAFIIGTLILINGVRLTHILLGVAAAAAAWPLLRGTLQDYMLRRIEVFLDPGSNVDAAFSVQQALISIGNGGWIGMGWGEGTQTQLRFLRVRHTDFIFSVIAEELGFVGSVLVLLLLFFVIWRLVRIADLAQDQFGRLITLGVAALIFFQTFVNVGMNLAILPVTGMTLPFLSYGGSSLVSMMVAVGLAQSVVMRHRKMDFS